MAVFKGAYLSEREREGEGIVRGGRRKGEGICRTNVKLLPTHLRADRLKITQNFPSYCLLSRKTFQMRKKPQQVYSVIIPNYIDHVTQDNS